MESVHGTVIGWAYHNTGATLMPFYGGGDLGLGCCFMLPRGRRVISERGADVKMSREMLDMFA